MNPSSTININVPKNRTAAASRCVCHFQSGAHLIYDWKKFRRTPNGPAGLRLRIGWATVGCVSRALRRQWTVLCGQQWWFVAGMLRAPFRDGHVRHQIRVMPKYIAIDYACVCVWLGTVCSVLWTNNGERRDNQFQSRRACYLGYWNSAITLPSLLITKIVNIANRTTDDDDNDDSSALRLSGNTIGFTINIISCQCCVV